MADKIEPEVWRMVFVRKFLGLTRTQLAKRMGYSVSYVEKIERGESPLTMRYLKAFCKALDASVDYILYE